jgi:hypothetical protein
MAVRNNASGYFRVFFARLGFFFASLGSGGVASILRSTSSGAGCRFDGCFMGEE